MKKAVLPIICFALIFSLSSCSEEARPDMEALSAELAEINENYSFEFFDAFLYEGAYQLYFSLCSEDDILLSVCTDEEGNIDSVTVTAYAEKMKTDGQRNAFMNFSSAVIDCFTALSDKEKAEKNSSLSYKKPNLYFSSLYETYESLNYKFIFSSNSVYISLFCEYFEPVELSS